MGTAGAFQPKSLKAPRPSQFTKNKTLSAFANKDYVAANEKYLKDNPDIAINKLEDARKTFVAKTGGKLRDVKTAGAYKKMSESTQAKYKKRNPKEFPVGYKLGKQSILGA